MIRLSVHKLDHKCFPGVEAQAAICEGRRLASVVDAAGELTGRELELALSSLRQELETASVPISQKAALKERISVLTKNLIEQQKAMASDNKKIAAAHALAGADEVHNEPVFACIMYCNICVLFGDLMFEFSNDLV